MTLGNRIKKIRIISGLTQAQFAERIGSVQNVIARYENDRRKPSASVLALICREFGVNEAWLKTGEGEMTISNSEDVLRQLAQEYHLSRKACTIVEKFVKLPPDAQNIIIDFCTDLAESLSSKDE